MKKKYYIFFILMVVLVWILPILPISSQIKICYEGILDTSFTQIFFDSGEGYNEHASYLVSNSGDEAIFSIPPRKFKTEYDIRIDMCNGKENFILDSIQIYKNGIKIHELDGEAIQGCISHSYDVQIEKKSDGRLFCKTGMDSQIFMNENFKNMFTRGRYYYNMKEKVVLSVILLIMISIFWLAKLYGYQILRKVNKMGELFDKKTEFLTINQMEKIKQFLKKNRYAVILLIVYAGITYGYEITNWTLTIDEEIVSYRSKGDCMKGWIGDGRWGLGILKFILPSHKVLPYFNSICAVLVLIICAMALSYIIQRYISSKVITVIASIVFITMPLHSYYLMFDTFSVEISLGFLFAIMSGYFSTEASLKKSKMYGITSIILLVLSIAIYQLYFLVYACMVCVILILNMICDYRNIYRTKEIKEYYWIIIRSIVVLVASMTIYAIINFILQSIFGKSNYVDGYFRWSYIDISTCIEQTKWYLEMLFTRPEDLFKGGGLLSFCYLIYSVHFMVLLLNMKGKRVIVFLTYLGLTLSMCFQYILFAGQIPLRSQQVLSVYICFAIVLLSLIIERKYWRDLICLLSCLLSLYQASIVVELFYSENIRQKQDENLLSRIIVEIEELNLGEVPQYPVAFVGKHDWNSIYKVETEQFCVSMFNTGQIGRIYVWMNVLGYSYLQPLEEQQHKAEEIAQSMPVWPHDGAVALVDDIIIVNLGDEN